MEIFHNDWAPLLAPELAKPYYKKLRAFLIHEYRTTRVYPDMFAIFNALHYTSYAATKVVILGQDPYHGPGQAHGLCFSVQKGVMLPPSLQNIYKELHDDLGLPISKSGDLTCWAKQGVLLLNTVLTVRAHQAGSHRGKGWEQFTDRIIELLASRQTPMVFILWGANAGAKEGLILKAQGEHRRHLIIKAPHPSPLSAYRGFFGGSYFSRCNYFLEDNGIEPVDWSL